MPLRQCPNCGKYWPEQVAVCQNCREPLLDAAHVFHQGPVHVGGLTMRRGLLFMLLAVTLHYFLSPSNPLQIPFVVHPIIRQALLPLLFVSGAGLVVRGIIRRATT